MSHTNNQPVEINKIAYQDMARRILEMDEAYYVKDDPIATNAEYDALKKQLEQIEAAHPDWVDKTSPSNKPGGRPSRKKPKILHRSPLLSLQDYFSMDDLNAWCARIQFPVVSVEEKIDGLTLALLYKNGRLVSGATRGDGRIGEDVTHNVPYIKGIPERLNVLDGVDDDDTLLYVRLECYQPVAEFLRCNENRIEDGLEPYTNPRACAAGGLRSDDFRECLSRGLHAFAFQIIEQFGYDEIFDNTQIGSLKLLKLLGFDVVPGKRCMNFKEIVQEIKAIEARKANLPYWTDGAVIKTDDLALAAQLGAGNKYPVHSAAYKYPAEIAKTTLLGIRLQVGRTGVVTPVGEISSVQLAGTTVSNVTLHNQKFIRDRNINIGCQLEVTKSGEIIPKVVGVPEPAPDYFRIDTCPECRAKLTDRLDQDGNPTGVMVCENTANCPAQFTRYLEFFCSKDVMDIAGMGPAAIKTLTDAGMIEHVWQIYDLPKYQDQITVLPGFGKTSAEALAKAIEKSKNNDIDRLIKSLGIPGVGRHIGRLLAKKYQSMADIMILSMDELMAIEGIGEITARDFTDFWKSWDGQFLYENLRAKGVNTLSKSYKPDSAGHDGAGSDSGPLAGMTIVATGTIEGFGRADIEDFITQHGGKASGSVSKKTSCVIAGANAGSKLKKAQDLGVPVYTIQAFREKFGI